RISSFWAVVKCPRLEERDGTSKDITDFSPRQYCQITVTRQPDTEGLHNGLGAPPLSRLAPQSSAVVSGTSRGLGLGRFPQPEAANRIRLSHPTGSVARTPCDRELLPREVRSYQRARQQRMSLIKAVMPSQRASCQRPHHRMPEGK